MTYILVDSANLFWRGRHVVRGDLDTRVGMCMHIMFSAIYKAWRDFGGSHVVFCHEGRSWRKDFYAPYKANRRVIMDQRSVREQEDDELYFDGKQITGLGTVPTTGTASTILHYDTNGTAIVDVIKSCCPRISDPTEMPYNDVEAVLLAIRRATYGDDLAVSHKCKNAECGEEAQYAKSIDALLANVPMLEAQYVAEIKDGLKVFLKPISLFSSTELQIQAVEQQKLVERADAFDGSGEHVKAFQDSIIKIAMSNVKILTQCIYQIEMQDGKRVDQPEFISEWINNIDVAVFNQLMAKLLEIQDIVMKVEMDGECHKCKEPFNIPIIIDQSRFFGLA